MEKTREYTVKQLADLSGVSPRTLRYYDQIGLLNPARVTEAGYRVYTSREADMLQQILLYRALDFSLEAIGRLVHQPGIDRLSALEDQRARLEARRRTLDSLIETVDRTIASEKGGKTMKDSEKFACFKQEKLEENERLYGAEVRKAYGEQAADTYNRRFASLSEAAYQDMEALGEALLRGLEEAVRRGVPPASETGRQLAGMHRKWLGFTLPECTDMMQQNLCQMYLCDPRFTAYYDKNQPGCAQFLHDAVAARLA